VQAARHAPWLAHLLVRLLMVQIRRLGPHEWADVIFRNLEPDTTVMRRPALMSGIVGTYSFYLNQQGAGFEQDLPMMLTDWGSFSRPYVRPSYSFTEPATRQLPLRISMSTGDCVPMSLSSWWNTRGSPLPFRTPTACTRHSRSSSTMRRDECGWRNFGTHVVRIRIEPRSAASWAIRSKKRHCRSAATTSRRSAIASS
jgi:hypothetical protein